MNLILLGAPGAGKGTQAEKICEKLGIPAISTGNILREAIANKTEMGLKAKAFIDAGKLVPDEVVIGIINDRLKEDDCKNGFILDGFPRTIPQAEALDKMDVKIDKVIDIEVADEAIAARLSGRRVCLKCGATYHTEFKAPVTEGVCDVCGEKLVQRKDESENGKTGELRFNSRRPSILTPARNAVVKVDMKRIEIAARICSRRTGLPEIRQYRN